MKGLNNNLYIRIHICMAGPVVRYTIDRWIDRYTIDRWIDR